MTTEYLIALLVLVLSFAALFGIFDFAVTLARTKTGRSSSLACAGLAFTLMALVINFATGVNWGQWLGGTVRAPLLLYALGGLTGVLIVRLLHGKRTAVMVVVVILLLMTVVLAAAAAAATRETLSYAAAVSIVFIAATIAPYAIFSWKSARELARSGVAT